MITEIRLEQESVNDTSAVVLGWFISDGQRVSAGDTLLEAETSKVTFEVEAPAEGYVVPAVPVRHEARIGDVLALLCEAEDELAAARARRTETGPEAAEPAAGSTAGGQRFSPAALTYAREHGIPLERFAGMPVVTMHDVRAAAATAAGTPDGDVEPLSRNKALEVDRLAAANGLNAALSIQFDGTEVRRRAAGADVPSLRLLAIAVHGVAGALAAFPRLNGWYDEGAGGIRRHETVAVGIAIDLDDELKVGVVHDADQLDLPAVEHRIGELVNRYLNDELTIADVSGGSTTVSDLSMEDILVFQPLLNHAQALAIGLGGDRSLPGTPISLTATFDHRVASGREVSRFLNLCRRIITEVTP
jgi:pyruvate/2-oxoglutarate dehydrogenase complex dihydrolipoamide acyltransferase (E2) component